VDNKLYFAGGVHTNGELSSRIDIFDTTTSTWSKTAYLPTARQQIRCNVVGRYIVFSYGQVFSPPHLPIGINYCAADVFDTSSQSFTKTVPLVYCGYGRLRISTLGSYVIFMYELDQFALLDPATGSLVERSLASYHVLRFVNNSTHLFAVRSFDQITLHQVDLDTLTLSNSPTYSMTKYNDFSQDLFLKENFLVVLPWRVLLYTLGRPDPVEVKTGQTSSPLFHDSTIYVIQSASIIEYHPERGTIRYAMPQEFLPNTFSSLSHDRTLYFSGSQHHIATIQLDGLMQYSTGGPFFFGNRDIGLSLDGPYVSWLNLHTRRVHEQHGLVISPNRLYIELRDYLVFNSGDIFEISTETWRFIENPSSGLIVTRGISNFEEDVAVFISADMKFSAWHARDHTWRVYQATNVTSYVPAVYSIQDKLIVLRLDTQGTFEVIEWSQTPRLSCMGISFLRVLL
jgi:hypothetical protein